MVGGVCCKFTLVNVFNSFFFFFLKSRIEFLLYKENGTIMGRNRVNIGSECVYGYSLMRKMKAFAFQTSFDFNKISLVSVLKMHSIKPVSRQ